MYLLVILLPILGSLLVGFFGLVFGKRGSIFITVCFIGLAVLFAFMIFYKYVLTHVIYKIKIFTWVCSGSIFVEWGFLFDSVTSIMLLVVTLVSFLVHIYSIEYMRDDKNLSRFMAYLSMFTSFMIILVTADNFLQMFLGWEGVGLASYLLINFWHTRINANKAAIKAIIVNRIGDCGIILAIVIMTINFLSLDYYVIFPLISYYSYKVIYFCGFYIYLIDLIAFFLFLGAIGKSAQIGLHTWLPDAMEGPTPVSALIHAATMVTAGVFLIIRCSAIFQYSPVILNFMVIIGALTAFLAATIGAFQNDLKKVIAYSTCSQLGYMVFGCGLSAYSVSLFHLSNHAFFKALLFLSAGAIIHAINNEQDMRRMGGLIKIMPFTYVMFLIGSLALAGFPFLSGYYSKDLLLEIAFGSFTKVGHFAYCLGVVAAFFTSFYSLRVLYLTFYIKTNSYKAILQNIHEISYIILIPLSCLCLGSIFIGYLSKDLMVGVGTDFWRGAIFNSITVTTVMLDCECLPIYIKLVPTYFSLFGFIIAFLINFYFKGFALILLLNSIQSKIITIFRYYYTIINKKWFFDNIYNRSIVLLLLTFGYDVTFKLIDRGLIEIFGPLGLTRFIQQLSTIFIKLQTGYLYTYNFLFFIGFVLILSVFLLQNLSMVFISEYILLLIIVKLYFIVDYDYINSVF